MHPARFARLAQLSRLAPLALLLAGLANAGTVQVHFIQPARFADAGRGIDAERVRQTLDKHLQALGQQGLPAQQTLRIDVLDIDLAGETRPMTGMAQELRVLKGRADWPQMHLRYTLSDGGRVIDSGDEQLSDMGYLSRIARQGSTEALPYERRMLSDWFRRRFAGAAQR